MTARKLCMIPGPVEIDPVVQETMATPATSHVDPGFIETFGQTLELLRKAFFAPNGQPFVVAGSGTLTWDMAAANLVEPGESVLVVNTGVFGDWFGECFEVYGAQVTHLRAPFGGRPELQDIQDALQKAVESGTPFKLISLTHVDTSTSVLVDIQAVSQLCQKVSPSTLVCVDGVCSVGAEAIHQEEWGIDVVLTASQKALGVPPGLGIMVVSQRALDVAMNRKAAPSTYFGSFKKWLPIMKKYELRQPSYFATPPVQLIMSLHSSLKQLVHNGMEKRFIEHVTVSDLVKDTLTGWGLKIVPLNRNVAAHSLTAVYYPSGITAAHLLPKITSKGVVVAGGLHPQHATEYFRVGHMHISAVQESQLHHISTTLQAIKEALTECNYSFPKL